MLTTTDPVTDQQLVGELRHYRDVVASKNETCGTIAILEDQIAKAVRVRMSVRGCPKGEITAFLGWLEDRFEQIKSALAGAGDDDDA